MPSHDLLHTVSKSTFSQLKIPQHDCSVPLSLLHCSVSVTANK